MHSDSLNSPSYHGGLQATASKTGVGELVGVRIRAPRKVPLQEPTRGSWQAALLGVGTQRALDGRAIDAGPVSVGFALNRQVDAIDGLAGAGVQRGFAGQQQQGGLGGHGVAFCGIQRLSYFNSDSWWRLR